MKRKREKLKPLSCKRRRKMQEITEKNSMNISMTREIIWTIKNKRRRKMQESLLSQIKISIDINQHHQTQRDQNQETNGMLKVSLKRTR